MWDFFRGLCLVQYLKINVIYYVNVIKGKICTTIIIVAEKVFNKVQHPFMIKTLSSVGIEDTYLNIVKTIYDKPTASIILNG